MNNRLKILIGLLALLLSACGSNEADMGKMIARFESEDNGLTAMAQYEDLFFILSYLESETHTLKVKNDIGLNPTQTDSLAKREKRTLEERYRLRVYNNEGTGGLLRYQSPNVNEYNNRKTYFGFQMKNDIDLIVNKDTITPFGFHFVNNASLVNYDDFILSFNVPAFTKGDRQFRYKDKILQLKNIIELHIKGEAISNIPIPNDDL